MVRVFRSRAGWFVAFSWMLLVVAIPICLAIAASAGINAFYFPAHRMAPLDRYDIKASEFAMAVSLVGTIVASVALALKFRIAASLLVVAIWIVILFGTQGARLLVQPGPEYFERHLGQELFSVPWQYGPASHGSTRQDPGEIGLSVLLLTIQLEG